MNNARPGSFVNAAGINSDDSPAVVVRKLDAAWDAGKSAEAQEVVGWQFWHNGEWRFGSPDHVVKDHRKNTEAAGIPVRDVYAAPVAAAPVCADCSTPLLYECVGCSATNYPPRTPAAPGIDLEQFREAVHVYAHRMSHACNADGMKKADGLLALIDASPKGIVFENHGDSEANFIADSERLNCPTCAGSGHVDDGPMGGDVSEALAIAYRHLDVESLRVSHCNDLAKIHAALQATSAEVGA